MVERGGAWWSCSGEEEIADIVKRERAAEGGTAKGETGGARLRRTLKHREENIRDSRRTA